MAFEGLAAKLQNAFKNLRGKGKLNAADVEQSLREVRVALLEADVNYKVVKDFINKIKERAVGKEVLESLTPVQQVIKIVNEELTQLMGGSNSRINIASKPPTVIMVVGLQGSGKTTTSGKLARLLKKQGRKPLLVACDIYRPAAIKQLQTIGDQLEISVFTMGQNQNPVDIAKAAHKYSENQGYDTLILDTAGRLHIDEKLMEELADIKENCRPHEILLVVDAMTGQDAVNVAQSFNDKLGLDGIVLTKLDGDSRGGAALSVKAVTGKPIKFAGIGEKMDALEPFHPERMSSRILGMGDVLTLIEKAQSNIDAQKAAEFEKKLRKNEFTLEDFLDQLQQMKKMGPIGQLMDMIPGMGKFKELKDTQLDEKDVKRTEAIVLSMTKEERRKPEILNGSRRKRIAQGSGTSVQEVNKLLKQYEQTHKMMKQFSSMQQGVSGGKKSSIKFPFGI